MSCLGHRASEKLKLAVENAHPMDARVEFVEDGHTYYVDGEAMPISVTGLIESVASDHFDADEIIAKMKRGANWPNRAYVDVNPDGTLVPWTDDRIKTLWADSGARAAALGTDLHSKIEEHLNDRAVHFAGDDSNRVEFQYFLDWWEDAQKSYEPYRTEWVIFDAAAKVAGSIDFVMRNKTTGKFHIVDWKRCKTHDRGFLNAFGKRFLPPLHHLDQHKSNKWMVQVNVYREMLERNYGIEIEGMSMVVFYKDNGKAEVHSFKRLPEIAALLKENLHVE
jgi:hypothetical protein